MVTCHHHEGVVKNPLRLQRSYRILHHGVEVLNLYHVIQQIVPHNFIIRKDRRYDHLGRVFTGFLASAGLEGTMRFKGAEPKTKRLAFVDLLQKGVKIRTVISVGNKTKGRFPNLFSVFRSRRVACSPSRRKTSRTPSLARETNSVPCLLEEVSINRKLHR